MKTSYWKLYQKEQAEKALYEIARNLDIEKYLSDLQGERQRILNEIDVLEAQLIKLNKKIARIRKMKNSFC